MNSNRGMKWPAERLSMRLFYALAIVCIVVFAMYWLVGYDRPFVDNANFNAPLFTDAVLVLAYLYVAAAIAMAVWSVVRALKVRGKGEAYDNNVPVKKIGYCVAGGVAALLLLTFAVGSSVSMRINGVAFTDVMWLKISDMFITSSLVLLLIAALAVVYGSTKYIRRK